MLKELVITVKRMGLKYTRQVLPNDPETIPYDEICGLRLANLQFSLLVGSTGYSPRGKICYIGSPELGALQALSRKAYQVAVFILRDLS